MHLAKMPGVRAGGGPSYGTAGRRRRELRCFYVTRRRRPINAAAPEFPLATSAIAPLRSKAESLASGDFSPLWCGQNASGCKEMPAAQLTQDLAANL